MDYRSNNGALDVTCLGRNIASVSFDTPLHLFCVLDKFLWHREAQALLGLFRMKHCLHLTLASHSSVS